MTNLVIYESNSGAYEVRIEGESAWLNLDQLSVLFGRDRSVIGKHIRKIFSEEELEKTSVWANFAHTAEDGKTYQVDHFNLDVIISVGYRVKSVEGTRFRQWATKVLQEHLVKGYTIQQQRFEANAKELETALTLVRRIASKPELEDMAGKGLADIVSRYAQTFLILQRYDEGLLTSPPVQEGGILPTITEARSSLLELKKRLIERKEATDLFAREPNNGLEGILGNLDQSVFGDPAYPSLECKAAHLLYFIIKNHPFNDGNKRSGAFLFVDFLNKNNRLLNRDGQPVINDNGLAALTLLVAESSPTQKETMIALIMNMLANP
jgi:prophage maintenance system killer protein